MRIFTDVCACNDDGVPTASSQEQTKVERTCKAHATTMCNGEKVQLNVRQHVARLRESLRQVAGGYQTLDASRPWLIYWTLHSLAVLGESFNDEEIDRTITFLASCRTAEGGYAGAPGQVAHLATTYAAVMALVELKSDRALQSIDRPALTRFIRARCCSSGALTVHDDGEQDLRAMYCAAAVISILRLEPILGVNNAVWAIKCQTYEGGFAAEPGAEAHGGYTYCAVAALRLLNQHQLINTDALLSWLANRQMQYEGGFQGRINKLVDGCYSFWQAAVFPIVQEIAYADDGIEPTPLFDAGMLVEYLLRCCQNAVKGGMRDKPGKSPDLYHTCYCLSGLSIAINTQQPLTVSEDIEVPSLVTTHPLYNVTTQAERFALVYEYTNQ